MASGSIRSNRPARSRRSGCSRKLEVRLPSRPMSPAAVIRDSPALPYSYPKARTAESSPNPASSGGRLEDSLNCTQGPGTVPNCMVERESAHISKPVSIAETGRIDLFARLSDCEGLPRQCTEREPGRTACKRPGASVYNYRWLRRTISASRNKPRFSSSCTNLGQGGTLLM